MEKTMEKKNNGTRFVKMFFSMIFLILMSISFAYGVYRGSDYLVKERSKLYQENWGYLQNEEDTEETFIQVAEDFLDTVQTAIYENRLTVQLKKPAYEINEPVVQISDIIWSQETEAELETRIGIDSSVYDYGFYEPYFEGIHAAVILEDYYYERQGITGRLHKYMLDDKFDYDTFFYDKIVALKYDGNTVYIQYADGNIREYKDIDDLSMLEQAVSNLGKNIDKSKVQLYIWVDEGYYADKNIRMQNIETLKDYNLRDIIISFVIAGISFLMASLLSVRTKRGSMRKKQIYTEVPLILLGFGIAGECYILSILWDVYFVYNRSKKILVTLASVLLIFAVYLCVREGIIKCKERRFWKDFCIIKFVRKIGKKCRDIGKLMLSKSNYKNFSITKKLWIRRILFIIFSLVYMFLACMIVNRIGVSYDYTTWGYYYEYVEPFPIFLAGVIYIILFILYNYYEMKFLKSLNDVYKQIDDIYHGEYAIRKVEEDDMTYDVTQKLNGLSNGLGDAIEKRISSEKMKVELVTNVSHDLKTPLTSIISYVNLLKQEEMTDVAVAYVKILEDKSYQLRDIVSDVFDLAKANSGQDVEIETIDGIMLINQVLADMSDTIERSGKIIKADIRPDTFFIKGDGKKLYRALQNLIDNALKYSMEGTRIYINSGVIEDKLVFIIKNIAAYEMAFSGEDIVERFVRGDEARTSEGNGLGLSIAKSFVEVSGGKMKAEVDGDVFKVTVQF